MGERLLSRVDLAIEQLHIAISLFLKSHNLASALTLAGATEEILGAALGMRGQTNALQHWYQGEAQQELELSWASFCARENRARNALKHLDQFSLDTKESIDLRDASAMMIYRACTNYEWLGYKPTKKMRVFERWFWRWAT